MSARASPPSAHGPCGWGQKQLLLPWAPASGCPCGITPHLPRGSDCCRPALFPTQGFLRCGFHVFKTERVKREEPGEDNRPAWLTRKPHRRCAGPRLPGWGTQHVICVSRRWGENGGSPLPSPQHPGGPGTRGSLTFLHPVSSVSSL